MSRLLKFRALQDHPMLGKDFARLSLVELEDCVMFITEYGDLPDDEFMLAANRWKLDKPKYKNHAIQWSLLISCVDSVGNLKRRKQMQKNATDFMKPKEETALIQGYVPKALREQVAEQIKLDHENGFDASWNKFLEASCQAYLEARRTR